jgi:hypothetical protein
VKRLLVILCLFGLMATATLVQAQQTSVVKYNVETFPNPDVRDIHLTYRLTERDILTSDSVRVYGVPAPPLMVALLKVDGVVDVTFGKYYVRLEKGHAFKWIDVMPRAIAVIESTLNVKLSELPPEPSPAKPVPADRNKKGV